MEVTEKYQFGGYKQKKPGYFSKARIAARKRKRKDRKRSKTKGVFCTENPNSPNCSDPVLARYGGKLIKKHGNL
jgi:hypothetical protein